MTNNDEGTEYAPLIALGDQIQQACDASNLDIVAVVFLDTEGRVEYRSKLDNETLREVLYATGEML